MLLFAVKRLIWAAVMVLVVSLITFVLFFVIRTTDTAGERFGANDVALRDGFNLEGPLYMEYLQFVKRVFIDHTLGNSFHNGLAVTGILERGAPVTGSLILGGMVLMLLVAMPLGILAALRPRSLVDRGATLFVLLGLSAHPAWVGLILLYFFGYRWNLFPIGNYCDFFSPPLGSRCGGPVQWSYSLVLPWVTFAVLFTAMYTRMIRVSVMDTLREDYVRTARAKGLPERKVMRKHVLRNSMLPVVAMLGLDASGLAGLGLTAVIFIERVYGLPGLGTLMLEAIRRSDAPVVLGVVVFMSTAIIIINVIVDIALSLLDPRMRQGHASFAPRLRRRRSTEPTPVAVEPAPL